MPDLTLIGGKLSDGSDATIEIADGRISAIHGDAAPDNEGAEIDLQRGLVLPALVEGHIHLDKCFIGDRWHPYRPGNSIAERIRIEREALALAKPVLERARALVEQCVANGTSYIRTHIDIDPDVGLRHLEAVLQVREEYRECVRIEVVAFPQHGILVKPGTLELMAAAIDTGAHLVGGLDPDSFDHDVAGHLGAVFGLADRKGVPIDIHLHDRGERGIAQIAEIADRAIAAGMHGKVAISHAYALGELEGDDLQSIGERLARAGVAIMTNAPGDHAFPPVLPLRAAGVTVFAGSDNVRDSWWPYGNADMLERAMMIGYRSGFYTDPELEIAFDLVSAAGAKATLIPDYGIAVGNPANLIVVAAEHVPEAVVAHPRRCVVLHKGRVVARDGEFVRL